MKQTVVVEHEKEFYIDYSTSSLLNTEGDFINHV